MRDLLEMHENRLTHQDNVPTQCSATASVILEDLSMETDHYAQYSANLGPSPFHFAIFP